VKVAVTLAQAVLKGDKMDGVIRDAVMMGVASILPVVTSRSEITLASLTRGRRHERWQRVTVSSAKQCGRATIPAVLEPRSFEIVADDLTHLRLPGPGFMLVEPGALAGASALTELDPAPPREATLMIGPEGGWTSDEIKRASASCRLLTLGTRTIRADAMPIVALTALFTHWREF
jgi:16S rRNA (uracil1498-N3)-methyltransferase